MKYSDSYRYFNRDDDHKDSSRQSKRKNARRLKRATKKIIKSKYRLWWSTLEDKERLQVLNDYEHDLTWAITQVDLVSYLGKVYEKYYNKQKIRNAKIDKLVSD